MLGKGAYGIVYKGLYRDAPVAVKCVPTGVQKLYIKSLLSELKLMTCVQGHGNVISLVGANTSRLKYGTCIYILSYPFIASQFARTESHVYHEICPKFNFMKNYSQVIFIASQAYS